MFVFQLGATSFDLVTQRRKGNKTITILKRTLFFRLRLLVQFFSVCLKKQHNKDKKKKEIILNEYKN